MVLVLGVYQTEESENIKTKKLCYEDRSYFISFKNIVLHSKHFFKLENMVEYCRCAVIYWATSLPFSLADWQLDDSYKKIHFCGHLCCRNLAVLL